MKKSFLLFSVILFFIGTTWGQSGSIGMMPYPQKLVVKEGQLVFPTTTYISYTGNKSLLIEKAITRFSKKFKQYSLKNIVVDQRSNANIQIEWGKQNNNDVKSKEGYTLSIDEHVTIKAITEIGILNALESLAQLLNSYSQGAVLQKMEIQDWPSFPWRGMMVDVARHFIPLDIMKRNVDAMAAVKYNTLHLHLSDDEGFRIESKKYPKLQALGSNGEYYTQAEMLDLIAYCKDRGIVVYPEFDLPGHSQSWFAGYPELAAEKKQYYPGLRFKVTGDKPMNLMTIMQLMNSTPTPTIDPSKETTYAFLDGLLKEMKGIFGTGGYVHMGLDENNGVAWQKNPAIVKFMQTKGIKNTHALQTYFANRFSNIIEKNGYQPLAWEEAFDSSVSKNILIQLWRPGFMGSPLSPEEVANQGNKLISSRGFYLDVFMPAYYHYLNDDFTKANISPNLLGGESAIWAELVDGSNFETRVWPRAAVIAERLWSDKNRIEVSSMYERMFKLNRYLSWNGLNQITNYDRAISEFLNGYSNPGTEALIKVLAPVKGYKRIMAIMTKPEVLKSSAFGEMADILPIDAEAKWVFRKQVENYLANPSEVNTALVTNTLNVWKNCAADVNDLLLNSPKLTSIRKHAENLSNIANLVLTYLPQKNETDKTAILKQINMARATTNEVDLAVIEELEALVNGRFKELDRSISLF
jgi:hexosaminidase